ncbi:hypothetical protein HNR42_001328 [Deinobacterium chartae]|uniref:Uncharacterized protein n=1 Tax=Deinobacterium chartae TaxID=521158 RepID=A0A841I1T2_9DEIO|nr:DUF6508 domain-containing protein [Deinobacterium chartae]MBB6097905.1 hypothetical protein [Deinobacterium chartae]
MRLLSLSPEVTRRPHKALLKFHAGTPEAFCSVAIRSQGFHVWMRIPLEVVEQRSGVATGLTYGGAGWSQGTLKTADDLNAVWPALQLAFMHQQAQKPQGNWQEGWSRIAPFLPAFTAPDFEFGKNVTPPSSEPDIVMMGYYEYSRDVEQFVQAAYDAGLVLPGFDWSAWSKSGEAALLIQDEQGLAEASPMQLAKLLTFLVRRERFAEGSLASAYESGLITRILTRASVLLEQPSTA